MNVHVAILSDLHNCLSTVRKRNAIPDADIYVFPGDMTGSGRDHELRDWRKEIQRLLDQGKKVVAIPGNHELGVEYDYANALKIIDPQPEEGFHWLLDSGCEIDGVTFWGTPWQPYFGGYAYNVKWDFDVDAEKAHYRTFGEDVNAPGPERSLESYWRLCPKTGIDVFISHGPPFGILDTTYNYQMAGSQSLAHFVAELKPQVHAFGHIHEACGRMVIGTTEYVNGSICTKRYEPINPVPVLSVRVRDGT